MTHGCYSSLGSRAPPRCRGGVPKAPRWGFPRQHPLGNPSSGSHTVTSQMFISPTKINSKPRHTPTSFLCPTLPESKKKKSRESALGAESALALARVVLTPCCNLFLHDSGSQMSPRNSRPELILYVTPLTGALRGQHLRRRLHWGVGLYLLLPQRAP